MGGKDRGQIRVSGPAYSDGPRRGRPGRDGGKLMEVSRHEVGLRSLGRPNALERQFVFSDDSYEWLRLFAAACGTFLLVLAAVGGPMVNARFGGNVISPGALVVAPGLMVLAIILFIGAVSGAHLNPAVTVGFRRRGDFQVRRVPIYVAAQFVRALPSHA